MKIVIIHNINSSNPYITLRPDNAILRNNDNFYIPHISDDIICGCGVVVRISRLAKCIAPKFASRCYDSITAGVTFLARDIMNKAIAEARPADEAYCFDHSTAIGTEWLTPEQLIAEGKLQMTISQSTENHTDSDFISTIDKSVAFASNKLTLKTGDLIFIANDIATAVKQGNNVVVTLNNTNPLNFSIK